MIMCTLLKRGPKSEDVTNVQFTFGKQPWVSSGHAIQSSRETQYSKRQGRLDTKKVREFSFIRWHGGGISDVSFSHIERCNIIQR